MRTTLDVDDDVLLAVKERARRERRSAGAVLSELARAGLNGRGATADNAAGRHGFRPLPHRGAPVTNAVIDALVEDE
jgi:hypothetical protein